MILVLALFLADASEDALVSKIVRERYTKHVLRVPMRDGVKLHTHAYVPKAEGQSYPIMLMRTPYGVAPYGPDRYPEGDGEHARQTRRMFPSLPMLESGFIFVQQDVRGTHMSEGTFVDVRPAGDIDESTDAYDTVEYLLKNVPRNNGKVGVWGTSYPGFFAAQAAVKAHPAVKAVSPQAPMSDLFAGDDFHHNGALYWMDAYLFYRSFGLPRPQPVRERTWIEGTEGAGDVYEFFMHLGTVANAPLQGQMWADLMREGTRSKFWQQRDPRPRYQGIKPAIMIVGGLFDAEDCFGAFETYKAFEKQNPGAEVSLVVGPWKHGGWHRSEGDKLGDISFATKTSAYYQKQIELPFFERLLKGRDVPKAPEATMFESGTNEWHGYAQWPPRDTKSVSFYLGKGHTLSTQKPASGSDSYTSDPSAPVPFTDAFGEQRGAEFIIGDQRFASRRPDVLWYETQPLDSDLTLSGPLQAHLSVSTTGTDADFVVKLVDVFPPSPPLPSYQMLVRYEVMRGKFRNSLEKPEPFTPNTPTDVRFSLPDVNHTFRAGHRLMVQVQSTLFPLVDRNPQQFMDIYKARVDDLTKQTHTVFHSSALVVTVLSTTERSTASRDR